MPGRPAVSPVQLAVVGAAVMMGHHVGSKSVRDALFLSHFDVTDLPLMVIGASLLSLVLVLAAAKAMNRLTPARMVPAAFAGSAVLYLGAGLVLPSYPRFTAIGLFLLVVSAGTLITSGFWALVSERLDPHTLRHHVGQIAAGGTVGVIFGGIVAERIGARLSIGAMFPVLAALHAVSSILSYSLVARTRGSSASREPLAEPDDAGHEPIRSLIRRAPYLHLLALLVLSGTVGAGLIDYVFKAQTVARFGRGEDLLRFFAVFNAGVGLLTFVLQVSAAKGALCRFGVGRTLGSLPAAMALGGFAAIAAPGLATAGLARGAEAILRGSLFRSGYELFYAPVPVREKRAAKPIIDVGFDRLGDGLAGGLVRLLLVLPTGLATQAILTLAVVLGLVGAFVALKLQDTYVGVLESNLLRRADDMEMGHFSGSILSSMTMLRLPASAEEFGLLDHAEESELGDARLLTALRYMTSGDPARVRYALSEYPDLDPLLVPVAIRLLASDAVYADALRALRRVAKRYTGQLVDALLDHEADSVVRRRIPRILSHCRTQRAADGLLLALRDPSLEVRLRCGRALSAIGASGAEVRVPAEALYEIVKWEIGQDQRECSLGESPDPPAEEKRSRLSSASMEQRVDSLLGHIFTLLSLVLPREPVRVAFYGLQTDDLHLRGTALEYLESVLPSDIHQTLTPYLTSEPRPVPQRRPAAEVVEDLMKSRVTIMAKLEERDQED